MVEGKVVAILVGMPQTYGTEGAADPLERPWTTALYKEPVAGPVRLGRENLAGDQPAQRSVHGGPEMAVLAYAAAHYPRWRDELSLPDLPYGAFGENLLVDGFDESAVCIGDVFAVGDARIQVSQPRGPCWKLERRWRIPDLIARVRSTGRGGWYCRVLAEGTLEAGRPFRRIEHPLPKWTITRVNQLQQDPRGDRSSVAELADCPLLSPKWRQKFRNQLNDSGHAAPI